MRQAFVVLNPVAGNSQPDLLRKVLEQRFVDVGWTYEI